jgi:lipopolysaccharide export system protein LptA
MRTTVLLIALLSFAALADGQTSRPPEHERVYIRADRIDYTETTVQFRGNVEIQRGSTYIWADEADFPMVRSGQMVAPVTLRGEITLDWDARPPVAMFRRQAQ